MTSSSLTSSLILGAIIQALLCLQCQSDESMDFPFGNLTCTRTFYENDEYRNDNGTGCAYCEEVEQKGLSCFVECLPEEDCDDDDDIFSNIDDTAAIIGIVSLAMACLCVVCLCVAIITYWRRRKTTYYPLAPAAIAQEHMEWDTNLSYMPPAQSGPNGSGKSDPSKTGSVKPEFEKQIQHQFQQQHANDVIMSAPLDDLAQRPSAPSMSIVESEGGAVTGKKSIYE